MTKTSTEVPSSLDPGSFRDREGRVFERDATGAGPIYRALSQTALDGWRLLEKKKLWRNLQTEGKVIATHEVAEAELAGLVESVPGAPAGGWTGALEHERVPFLSYPYEWSFSMLKDAALLQLELVRRSLKAGFQLKDATAYNVQWQGCRPVFIDIASFEPRLQGDPWAGYGQFCQLFLYPLLIDAYRGLPFQTWLRGCLDGIEPAQAAAALGGWRDRLRPGVLKDVWLLAKFQQRTQDSDERVRDDMRKAGFKKEMILGNVRRLEKVVGGLAPRRSGSEWSDYAEDNSYDETNRTKKEEFVETAARSAAERAEGRRARLTWDLGANTGHYSRLVAPYVDLVVSMDGDAQAVDRLFARTKADGPENLLPLVMNLVDPSPALGWRHKERKALAERPRPDLVLALALVHHLSIRGHVPLPELVNWLAGLVKPGGTLVVEFVGKADPMVQRLLRNQADIYDDYDEDVFEEELRRHFEIERSEELIPGRRRIYEAVCRL
ncbi:MAG: class I SAM-dependent methyltransferase [Thermoanaerobaculia bacterium]|nr:class I SAM-dependent methyltransferase [Thermoanaerobaculia bacterium]